MWPRVAGDRTPPPFDLAQRAVGSCGGRPAHLGELNQLGALVNWIGGPYDVAVALEPVDNEREGLS